MKSTTKRPGGRCRVGLAAAAVAMIATLTAWADATYPFRVSGTFVEGCSCNAPCPCQLTGVMHGCQGVGAMTLTSGSYRGVNLAGAKIVYATSPGQWVRLYVDVPNPGQRMAAEALGKAVYKSFGPIEAVKPARIAISGHGGRYQVSVDGGKTMKLTTQPVLGGDKRTPITISNIHDPLHPTIMQGRTIQGSYQDGARNFTLKDSNSYFTDRMQNSGKI